MFCWVCFDFFFFAELYHRLCSVTDFITLFSPPPNQFISMFHQSCFTRPSPVSSKWINKTKALILLTCCIQCNLVIVLVLQEILCIVQTAALEPLRDICNAFGCIHHLKETPRSFLEKCNMIAFSQLCTEVSSSVPSSLQILLGKNPFSQLTDGKQTLML